MTYNKPLPSMRSLKQLALCDGPFPMKGYRLASGAERCGFGRDMQAFLQLFPHDATFRSRDDFLKRCQDIETIIRSERDMPAEVLRSPQD